MSDTLTDITVNLDCTQRCNFECAHCMHSAGPRSGMSIYATDSTILRIARFFDQAIDMFPDASLSLNFVGGEPTLNLNQFRRIVFNSNYRMSDSVRFEMTTNGWWLEKAANIVRFAEAVRPMLNEDRVGAIRISNDKWHQEFRKDSPNKAYIRLFDEWRVGQKLWHEQGESYRKRLDNYMDEMVRDFSDRNPHRDVSAVQELIDHEAMHIATLAREYGEQKVSPVGRAVEKGIGYQYGSCNNSYAYFDVDPLGNIIGFCCLGSRVRNVAVLEDFAGALKMREAFMRKVSQVCSVSAGARGDDKYCDLCPEVCNEFAAAHKLSQATMA